MFRPCWVIFMEKLSVVVTLGSTVQLSENVLSTALRRLWRRELFVVSACTSRDYKEFTLNCIVQPSVTTTESFSLKMTQQGRNM
jgi:hypothetical protein